MQVVPLLLGVLVGLAAGGAVGFGAGVWARRTSRPAVSFWGAVALVFVVGLALSIRGQVSGTLWLEFGGIGLLGGGLTGLRYGFVQPFASGDA